MSRSRRLIAWLAKYKQTAPGLWAGGPHFLPFSREWGHHARGQDRMSTALSGSSSAGLFPFHTAHTAGCCWSAVGMETSLVSPFFFFFFFLAAICAFSGCARGVLGLTFQLGRSLLSPSHHIFPMWSHHPPPPPLLFCSPFLSLFLHASFYSELAWAP